MWIEPLENRLLLHHDPGHTLNSHVHSILTIYFDGVRQTIPMDVGVGPGLIAPIHTHDTTGKLHVEPEEATYDLVPATRFPNVGDFFEAWRTHGGNAGNNANAIFNSTRILDRTADASHTVRFYVNGALNTDYENYILRDGDDLVISYDTLPPANRPALVPLPDTRLYSGSPLYVSLDGTDAQGGPLSYTVTVSAVSGNPQLSATIPQGNRSARIRVRNYGDMLFQLLDDKSPRVTNHFVTLANLDVLDLQGNVKKFHQGVLFHRVDNGFVIQGGDPTGTGSGGSPLGRFDDQFHVDLAHNRRGLLSMAKSLDDTNDSQFFITDTPMSGLGLTGDGYPRTLDSQHSVFGVLVEGEDVRDRISNVSVATCTAQDPSCRPLTDVVIDSVAVLNDTENALLLLKAPQGAVGEANVTVTVRDPQNNTFQRTFRVSVSADEIDAAPFFDDIPSIRTTVGTAVTVPISARDVEDSPIRVAVSAPTGITVGQPIRDITPVGQVGSTSFTFTPAANLLGTFALHIAAYRPQLDPDNTFMSGHLDAGAADLRAGAFDHLVDRQVVLFSMTRNVTCAIADITDDGRVTRADLALLTQSLGATVTAGAGTDIDGDGRVGTRDVRWIKQFFGQNCPASSPGAPDGVVALETDRRRIAQLHASRVDAAYAQSAEPATRAVRTQAPRQSAGTMTTKAVVEPSNSNAVLASGRLTTRRRVATEQRAVHPLQQGIAAALDSEP